MQALQLLDSMPTCQCFDSVGKVHGDTRHRGAKPAIFGLVQNQRLFYRNISVAQAVNGYPMQGLQRIGSKSHFSSL